MAYPVTVGTDPYGIAITPDGTKLFVINQGANTISVVTVSTGVVAATLSPSGAISLENIVITPNGSKAYVSDFQLNKVFPITVSSNTVGTAIVVGTGPEAIASTPDSGHVYVANVFAGTISVIATASNTVVATISGFIEPSYLAMDPAGVYLWVADAGTGTVTPITIATAALGAPTYVGPGTGFNGIAITPNGSQLWILNSTNNSIAVVATSTGLLIATVPLALSPAGIAFNANGTRAFVATATTAIYQIESASLTQIVSLTGGVTGFSSLCIAPDSTELYAVDSTPTDKVVQFASLFTAPSAPTLGTPALGAYAGAPAVALPATYISTDYASMSAYALRVKVVAGTYHYWNAAAGTLTATSAVWNPLSITPNGQFTVDLPLSLFTSGDTYDWSFACEEAGDSIQGSFATDSTFAIIAAPTIVATATHDGTTGLPEVQLVITTTGLSGVSTIAATVIRSDGQYVRGAGWPAGTTTAILPASQTVTIYDVEATPGVAYTYQASVVTTGSAGISLAGTSGSATTDASKHTWLVDPTNPSSAVGFDSVTNPVPDIKEIGQLYYPLGNAFAIKSTDGTKGYGGQGLAMHTNTDAQDEAIVSLLENVNALWLMFPARGGFYIMWDPSMDRKGSIKYSTSNWQPSMTQNDWMAYYAQTVRP